MGWFDLTLQALLCLGGVATGWWAGRRGRVAALTAAAVAVGAIALRVVFRFFPELEYPLLSSSLYSAIQPLWMLPFAFMSIGVGLARSGRGVRAALAAGASALFILMMCRPWTAATFDRAEYVGVTGPDGICLQSQAFTCGAAAGATLLASLNMRASEAEMARLCGSAPLTGTDEISLCRALRHKLAGTGFEVILERPGPDSFGRQVGPVLVRMRSTPFRDHWVALMAINDRSAVVGDPLLGKVQMPVEEFLSQWRGRLVRVERTAGALALR